MTGFFDEPRPSGTNRHAPPSRCSHCEGDRLVPIKREDGTEAYARCPSCNPDPKTVREPVQGARWQDYDR